MIEFHGKPFLEYLVEMLREQGFERVLLLLGYLPEVIQDHFGDGSRFGIEIDYSVTGPDDLTVHRMKVARDLIEPSFLLMYCDNYWPMRMDRMWEQFVAAGRLGQITVYSNRDGYTKSSVEISDDGLVVTYDRTESAPRLQGVEISYAILTEPVLELLPEQDDLFEAVVYPELVRRGELGAYVTEHRYYSVGSHRRLALTDEFFARRPTVILDRDGVLNERPPRAEYVRSWDEFRWVDGALEALRLLADADYRVIVVSNQAGIARGAMDEDDLAAVHERMKAEAAEAGGRIDAIYFCPHGWDEGCECRKPRPGMLFQAQKDFSLDLSRTLFVGDDERDGEAADAAGCPFELVSDRSLLDLTRSLIVSVA
jgi:D-glycero-D-manno-heptose 1,7-bisphosphate phosphatase